MADLEKQRRQVFQAAFDTFYATGKWPLVKQVSRQLADKMDVEEVLRGVGHPWVEGHLGSNNEVALRLPAIALCSGGHRVTTPFLKAVQLAARKYVDPTSNAELTHDVLVSEAGLESAEASLALQFLKTEHLWDSISGTTPRDMVFHVGNGARKFREVSTIEDYLALAYPGFPRRFHLGGRNDPVAARVTEGQPARVPHFDSAVTNDEPLSDEARDKLSFMDLANSLAAVIDSARTATPLTIAVSGPWGVGKSSLAKMVENRLDGRYATGDTEPPTIIKFDAWMHDASEAMDASLVTAVARGVSASKGFVRRYLEPLPSALLSGRQYANRVVGSALAVLIFLTVAAWLLVMRIAPEAILQQSPIDLTWATIPEQRYVVAFMIAYAVVLAFLRFANFAPLARILDPPNRRALKGDLPEVARALRRLTATADSARFVVFIDNLDRCRPQSSIHVLEAIAQYLQIKNVIVVVLADTQTLARHADAYYGDLTAAWDAQRPDSATAPKHFGHDYLQKIFQLEFQVPRQNANRIGEYLLRLSQPERDELTPKADVRGFGARTKRKWARFVQKADRFAAPAPPVASSDDEQEDESDGRRTVSLRGGAWADWHGAVENLFRNPRQAKAWVAAFGALIWVTLIACLPLAFVIGTTSVVMATNVPISPWLYVPLWALVIAWLLFHTAALVGSLIGIAWRLTWLAIRGTGRIVLRMRRKKAPEPGPAASLQAAKQDYGAILLSEEDSIRQALVGLGEHAPSLPRSAKRVMASIRLQALILRQRGLFTEHGVGLPELAKWVNLGELWPSLAGLIRNDPALLTELEELAGSMQFQHSDLETLHLNRREKEALRRYLAQDPPFGNKVWSLVRMEAAPTASPAAPGS